MISSGSFRTLCSVILTFRWLRNESQETNFANLSNDSRFALLTRRIWILKKFRKTESILNWKFRLGFVRQNRLSCLSLREQSGSLFTNFWFLHHFDFPCLISFESKSFIFEIFRFQTQLRGDPYKLWLASSRTEANFVPPLPEASARLNNRRNSQVNWVFCLFLQWISIVSSSNSRLLSKARHFFAFWRSV